MYPLLKTLLLCILLPAHIFAQILPREGAALHYRIIGFSFPSSSTATKYTLEIARGNFNTEDSFKKNIVSSLACKDNKAVVEVPAFGSSYTWRVSGSAALAKNGLHHFIVADAPCTDTASVRLRITAPALKYKDSYVFLNSDHALYDMNGNLVWYLPGVNDTNLGNKVADIKCTPFGTITCLLKNDACEINYNGDILWKAHNTGIVSGGTSEHYHHEFTRRSNGHYMVLGSQLVDYKANPRDSVLRPQVSKDASRIIPKTEFGTVIEYNEKGDMVWSWRSLDYFTGSDLEYYVPPKTSATVDVHENSFFFDEKKSFIYVSFKNISRILKIKYPEGTVSGVYGEAYLPGAPEKGNGLYCHQHSVRLSSDGYVYLFNNNLCNKAAPSIIMMQGPDTGKAGLKKVWEYTCPVDDNFDTKFTSGGNVDELPDHSFFVCMGSKDSKIFIVGRDKKILWSAMPEHYNGDSDKWETTHQSRASIVSRKDLEKLIWNAAKGSGDHPAK